MNSVPAPRSPRSSPTGNASRATAPRPREVASWIYDDPCCPGAQLRVTKWVPGRSCDRQGQPRAKSFTQTYRTGPTRVWVPRIPVLSGIDAMLYKLDEVREAVLDDARYIFWTEGESDADALAALGCVATTQPGGALAATPDQARHFRDYTGKVLITVDRDRDGYRGGLRRAELLAEVGVRYRLLLPRPRHAGADVRDHLAAGHTWQKLLLTDEAYLGGRLAAFASRRPALGGQWHGSETWDPDFDGKTFLRDVTKESR